MLGETIQSLIAEGSIAEIFDGRSGSWDGLVNGNDGVCSASMRQVGPAGAWVFPNTTDEVTVADVAGMRLTSFGIVAIFDCYSQTATEYLVAHDNAGSGYSFGMNATQLLLTGDGVTRTLAATLTGAKGIGVSCATGGTPVGYQDGVSLGNFSGAVTVTGASVVTEIGNWNNSGQCKSPYKAVLIANRVLTATEHAAVFAELVALRWPSKQYSMALSRQQANPSQAGIVAGWDMRPVNGTVIDRVGGYTGTINGSPTHENTILGSVMRCSNDGDYIEIADPVDGGLDVGTGDFTLAFWVKGVPSTVGFVYLIGKALLGDPRYYINLHGTGYVRALVDDGPNVAYADTAASSIIANKFTRVAVAFDRSEANGITIYQDGVDATSARTGSLAAVGDLNNGSSFSINRRSSATPNMTMADVRLYKGRAFTPADALADYLQGARAVQFMTDWGYPVSPADEGGTTGQQIGGFASPFRAGDTTGRWRVETDTIEGKTSKVLTCKTAGVVYVPASYFYDATPTEAAHGTWDWWARKADASVLDVNFIATVNTGITTGYGMKWAADESVVIYEYGVGNVATGGTAAHSTWTQFHATRSIAGLFTGYINGASFGTGTDTTTTTSTYMVFDMDAGDKICLSPHPVMKMLGVVAP